MKLMPMGGVHHHLLIYLTLELVPIGKMRCFNQPRYTIINIAFKGGKEKSSYSYSGSFLTQDGIVGGSKSNFTRFTNSASYNLDFLDNFKFKSGITLTRTNKRNLIENTLGSVLFNALNMAP